MTGVAAAGAYRRVIHRVGREAWRRVAVAIAALNPRYRNVRRHGQARRATAIVATGAIHVRRGVRESASRPRRRALVAGLARRDRRHVVRRLAERRNAVVTTGAGCSNSGVIERGRAGIADRALVATVAWRGGDDMIGRFAERDRTIVANGAWRSRLDVVDKRQGAPGGRLVTAFAEVGRLRMRLRFSLCASAVVAGEALPRRSLETPIHMARTAVDAGVRSRQRKSRREVIE